MISIRLPSADLRELAWPVLGTTAVALVVAALLRLLIIKSGREGALSQEQEIPQTCGTTTELQDFIYDKLPQPSEPALHAIRLLRIHSGDSGSQPSCTLETFNLEACPDYWALSYTWGAETPSYIILVNGKRFRIRQNLFNFVAAFRSPYNDEFYLWIDQICINQDDIPERNSQVRRMGQYYAGATCVITWLGIGTELELAAMARIQQVDIDNAPPAECKEPMTMDLLRGYWSLITNSYFERLWVVQEMARAKDILVMLGAESLTPVTTTWRHFNFAFIQLVFERNIISKTPQAAQEEMDLRQQIRDGSGFFSQLVEVKKRRDSTDIFELIEAFSGHKCADPRDKLYALHDIGHLEQQLFTIDYSKSKFQVYCDFVNTCMSPTKIGHILSERQADSLAGLGRMMGIEIEIQIEPKEAASGFEADVQKVWSESLKKLRESIDYVGDLDVLMFGPRYDRVTGRRASPLSKEGFRDRIPTTFRIPSSLDMTEVSKKATQDFYKLIGARPLAETSASNSEEADMVGAYSAPDGYTTIEYLSGDLRQWGLKILDADPDR